MRLRMGMGMDSERGQVSSTKHTAWSADPHLPTVSMSMSMSMRSTSRMSMSTSHILVFGLYFYGCHSPVCGVCSLHVWCMVILHPTFYIPIPMLDLEAG
jgi:hypothetical protein